MANATVRERVEKGAALLDETFPGWEQSIELDKLQLSSCEDCVCGQLALAVFEGKLKADRRIRVRWFRNQRFWSMCRYLGRKIGLQGSIDATEYGFDSYGNVTYTRLDREWGRLIRARLKAEKEAA